MGGRRHPPAIPRARHPPPTHALTGEDVHVEVEDGLAGLLGWGGGGGGPPVIAEPAITDSAITDSQSSPIPCDAGVKPGVKPFRC
jgi:hypothetical protein